ncbi:apolipoprotein D-like isoform X1 [Cotesia glomerata]|uniref:Lipocalin/cytosolic fatty-acid binding domain-containing protein n=1 Tax=Cotesia glomerata TaxID=32391 RepID=A0AAV7IUZ3_COTGL|nr:apolipoprotein D-like isoform X1 [Cotesia glomerata]KAH0555457.1 hypothetical protein KQX54_019076 [Cotesia glomerata]
MNSFIIVCCIIIAAYVQASQSKQIATCPKVRPMENLEISKKLFGNWYGCQESVTSFPELNKCILLIMEPNGPSGWSAISSGISNKTGITTSMTATVTVDEQQHAITSVHYNSLPPGPITIGVTILDTDYENYLLLWSCNDDQPQQTPGFWMLARNRTSCGNFEEKVKSIIDKIGITLAMNSIDQINCS